MLAFDLSDTPTRRIANDHKAFAGTDYARFPFAVTAKRITAGEVDAINRKHRTVTGKGSAQEVSFDFEANSVELFVYAVESWEGIHDHAGKPLPCTDATKAAVAKRAPDFAALVTLAARDNVLDVAVQDAEEKN
jgi:hypothetical protein